MATREVLPPSDRRRSERRTNPRIGELTLPEFRRIAITSTLFLVVVVLFLWMVRKVIIAAFLGVVIAAYLRPLYNFLRERVGKRAVAAILTLLIVIVPVLALLVYSYLEIQGVAEYLSANEAEVAARINAAVQTLPFVQEADVSTAIRRAVGMASEYGARLPGLLSELVGEITVAGAVFIFTAFYIFLDGELLIEYVRSKIPPRYGELSGALETNVRGVLYGAIYATLLTQTVKSGVILGMNLLFGVPLAVVLAIVSFIIGFFPIVGSWSVYVPVAGWLLVFRDAPIPALLMVAIGFGLNTVFMSLYLRPKIAAERSRVLNFYWMFLGLVTGVYTFGIAGILLGPILIGLLKAVVDTVTATTSWRLIEAEALESE